MENVSEKDIQFQARKKSQSGQAVIEYILVMVVVIGVIMGGLFQLNKAFELWANNYFGDYLSCLLETGELPTLGSQNVVGVCNGDYEPFTFSGGRPLADNNSGDGTSGNNNQNGADDGSGSDGDDSSGSGSGGTTAANGGGGGAIGSGARGSGRSRRFRANRGAGEDESGIERSGGGRRGAGGGFSSSDADDRSKRIAIGGRGFSNRYKDDLEDEDTARGRTPVNTGAESQKKSDRIAVKRTVAQQEEAPEVEGFTFGSFLRYLIIAAILIALILFFGGQLLSVSKSME